MLAALGVRYEPLARRFTPPDEATIRRVLESVDAAALEAAVGSAFKPWLAARPGQNKPAVAPATIAHRLGTLRMFFVRIDEWGWDEAPPRVPMFPGDLPRLDRPLPKALDDAAAARLLRAAQNDRRMLVRVTVEMLLRTGLRVSEYTALRADAVVLIGAGPWLHVPVGKLREDRYLPLHPQLLTLIDSYRAAHVPAGHPLLLPRENGRALDRHTVTRMTNRAGAAAGLGPIHPHQLRHTLATQFQGRGVASDATFRAWHEDGAVRDAGPSAAGQRSRRPGEPAGQGSRDRTLLSQMPGCCIHSRCIKVQHDAARATKKRSDEGRCHHRPVVALTYSAWLVNRSLPVNRGMSLEAIAAMPAYKTPQPGHDPALRQDCQPHRR